MEKYKEIKKLWRLRHPEIIRGYNNKYRRKWNEVVSLLKHKPCQDCQGWFNPWQMDFDHRPGTIKEFEISSDKRSTLKKIIKEIAKCDLVCANCHRDRTYKRSHI